MSEPLAARLATACRALLVLGTAGLVALLWVVRAARDASELPFDARDGAALVLACTACSCLALALGIYLSRALGVDVFGVLALTDEPRGKPFDGLASGEAERPALRWRAGALGPGVGLGLKVLLTDRRLLVGSSLTSWWRVDVPLARLRRASELRGPLRRGLLVLELERAARPLVLRLCDGAARARLLDELARLRVPVRRAAGR